MYPVLYYSSVYNKNTNATITLFQRVTLSIYKVTKTKKDYINALKLYSVLTAMPLTLTRKNSTSNNKVEDESREIQTNPLIVYLQDGRKLTHGSILEKIITYY